MKGFHLEQAAGVNECHMARLIFLLLAALAASFAPACAKEASVSPGINAPFAQPNFEEWVERFERGGREVFDKRFEIVAAVDIKPGMVVADIGAGTGLFTRLFSPEAGVKGRVIAVDISKTFIDNILKNARQRGLKNVTGIVNEATDAMLPLASVDIAFVCDTYHHFEFPKQMLASIHRGLKPNGALIIVDYERKAGQSSAWVMEHVRADKAVVIREIEAAGFRLAEDRLLMQTNYFLRFVKRD